MLLSINFPLFLTLVRLILSPLLIPLLFSILIPLNLFSINLCLASLFLILSLTDFFDGFLARRYNQITILGSLLDPIADKFLLFSALVTLVSVGKIFFYWAIVFIAREFFIMALRQVSLVQGFKIPVIFSAKLKTCSQTAYIIFAILNPHKNLFLSANSWDGIENLFLISALMFSTFSAGMYLNYFVGNMKLRGGLDKNEIQ